MQTIQKCVVILFFTIVQLLFLSRPAHAQASYFDDSASDLIRLGNPFYEIGFRKTDGGIAYITDKATGQHISETTRVDCLWSVTSTVFYGNACSYGGESQNTFQYQWSAASHTLTFTYTPPLTARQALAVQINLQVTDDHALDLQLQIENKGSGVIDGVRFPADLRFPERQIQQALLPLLPGVIVTPAFFAQQRSYTNFYPGNLFADYLALTLKTGQFALYLHAEQEPVQPLLLGLQHDSSAVDASTTLIHRFTVQLGPHATWTSPFVQLRIGQSFGESIAALRKDNGLDRFPSLRQKLGTQFAQVTQAPLYKADVRLLNLPFAQYPALLARVPTPGILHLVAYQLGGHDVGYPDFLPPDAAWGTTEEMATLFRQAQGLGFLVMPYINPVWWDPDSPTLQNLPAPLTLRDVVAFAGPGLPNEQQYGEHSGYMVSPAAPFVQERLKHLFQAFTTTLPSNLIFEDQVGAHPWQIDDNRFSPAPTAYAQGWLDHTHTYSNTLLMTENGFDRLAETEAGFNGSILLAERLHETEQRLGNGTWQVYPFAPLLVRDKVLFYQHNLAPETFTFDKVTLAWNLALGYMLSYDLKSSKFGGGVDSPWLRVVSDFQREVLARYADERMLGYTNIRDQVTQTAFEQTTVTTNWDATNPYPLPDYTLAPSGFVVTTTDHSLIAGIFTHYHGARLSAGDHYLIETRTATALVLRQSMGTDTELTVPLPPHWQQVRTIAIQAFSPNHRLLASFPVTVHAGQTTFRYQNQQNGQPVAYYRIVPVLTFTH